MEFFHHRYRHVMPLSDDSLDLLEPPSSSGRDSNDTHSTAPTSHPSCRSNDCGGHNHVRFEEHTQEFDYDDYFNKFREDVNVSVDCPGRSFLETVSQIPVYDKDNKPRSFGSLWSGPTAIGERQLIIFVRHFYCGACQAYLKALTKTITPQSYFTMPIPTSITVIGCGGTNMITPYKEYTGCPFPIYADPTRALYHALGMSWTMDFGNKRPDYMKDISIPKWIYGQMVQANEQVSKQGMRMAMKSGHWLQIGGEFLFENEEVIWCNRMKHFRDHAEIHRLKELLEIE